MNELIKITENEQGELFIDSRIMATALGIEHKALLSNIDKHRNNVEENFGRVSFEMEAFQSNGGVQQNRVAYLSEDQATFIATLSRNSENVIKFKAGLVKAFSAAKKQIAPIIPMNPFSTMSRKQMLQLAIESEEEKEALRLELKTANNENESLTIVTDLQKKQLQIAAPKVKYVDEVLKSESSHTTTIIAKEMGMSAIALNAKLYKKGVIRKTASGTWVLYAKYEARGYTKTNTHSFTDSHGLTRTSINTVWTEIGRQFIHSIL